MIVKEMLRHGSFLEKADIFDHSFFGITAKQASCGALPTLRSGGEHARLGEALGPFPRPFHVQVGFGSGLRSALRLRWGSRKPRFEALKRLQQDVLETVEG